MASDREKQRGIAVIERQKTERPRLYKVVFHNDDYTAMEFVIDALIRFFRHDRTSATRIMLHVHHTGIGIAGCYTKDIAETKQAQVLDYARANDYPLRVTTEPE